MAPGGQNAPFVILAEQLVGDPAHMNQVLLVGADAAQNSENGLDEQRRLGEAAIEEMGQRVEMAHVIALELEARAMALAQVLHDPLDVLEGVAEDVVAAPL